MATLFDRCEKNVKIYIGRYPVYKKNKEEKERKVRIRIDKYDTWSMDHTLGLIALPMLKQLKATKHGSPMTDDEDVPEELKSTSATKPEQEFDVDSNHFKRWDWIMDEMIWAFEQHCDEDSEDQFQSGVIDHLWQALDKNYKPIGEPVTVSDKRMDKEAKCWRMVDGPNHTWKYDEEGAKKFYERKRNGFRLFGKYYEALWD